jgi:hypothetical protein
MSQRTAFEKASGDVSQASEVRRLEVPTSRLAAASSTATPT